MTIEKKIYVDGVEINYLMYKSYEFQRDNDPDIEPKRWRRLYFNADLYEKIYKMKKKEAENVQRVVAASV